MRHFHNLLIHELRVLLLSPATYIAAVLFLLQMWWLYVFVLWEFSSEPHDTLPTESFFYYFWIPVLFVVPLLTMRSLAEERRLGTLETLMTTPVTTVSVVLSKYCAALVFYCLLWLLTLAFPMLTVWAIPQPIVSERILDIATLTGGYLFVVVSGFLFVAVGIFSSSLTRSQLVAGMLSFSILFMIILGPPVVLNQNIPWPYWLEVPIEYFDLFNHLDDFKRGVIDSRPLVYYVSNTALILGISVLVVESKV